MDSGAELLGRPDPADFDAQVVLADLRRKMFGRGAPKSIGRYRIVDRLGRGGFGTVYLAEDDELRRPVAVKVVPCRGGGPGDRATERLLREAQAMAQLSHPNVVEVYAAGHTDEGIWIAMELVRGTTLETWRGNHRAGTRSRFDEARQLLEQAAAGLAAAHARGLVHRDFKPSNVLVSETGEVKVADFGLARALDPSAEQSGDEVLDRSLEDRGPLLDTRTSAFAGTPRYMSPEQVRGHAVDATSDQFSFAVTAWEMVFDEHPFIGDAGLGWQKAIVDGVLRPPPVSAVPRWYRAALTRALAVNPASRFDDMKALVDALSPVRQRRRALVLGSGLTVASATAVIGLGVVETQTETAECSDAMANTRLASLRSEARRDSIAAGLARATPDGGPNLGPRLASRLDAYADAWTARYRAVCEDGRQSADFDALMACLRHSHTTLEAVLDRLVAADVGLAARWVTALDDVPAPAQCSAAQNWEPNSAEARALRDRLVHANADLLAGDYRRAANAATTIATEARAADLPTIAADALDIAGTSYGEREDRRRFEAFTEAYHLATASGDESRAARLAVVLARQHAYDRSLDEAERWIRHGESALERAPDDELALALDHVRTIVLQKSGSKGEAIAALEAVAAALPEGSPVTSELAWLVHSGLASGYASVGRYSAAAQAAERLHLETTTTLGPSHPRLVRIAMLRVRVASGRGELEAALDHATEAVRLAVNVFGEDSPRTGNALVLLAWVHHQVGDLPAAEAAYLRALAAGGATLTPFMLRARLGLAALWDAQGKTEDAVGLLQDAADIAARLYPEGGGEQDRAGRMLVTTLAKLSEERREAGRISEADAVLDRAKRRCRELDPQPAICATLP